MRISTLFACLISLALVASAVGADDENTNGGDSDFKAVQVKLAETRVNLAELELKVAVDSNKKSPGLIPEVVIETLEQSLARAKAQQAVAKGDAMQAHEALLQSADAAVQIAKLRLKRLEEARIKTGDVGETAIERAKLRLQVAEFERASVERLPALPMEQQLRWQIERINAMIDGISDRVIVLEDRR